MRSSGIIVPLLVQIYPEKNDSALSYTTSMICTVHAMNSRKEGPIEDSFGSCSAATCGAFLSVRYSERRGVREIKRLSICRELWLRFKREPGLREGRREYVATTSNFVSTPDHQICAKAVVGGQKRVLPGKSGVRSYRLHPKRIYF